MKDTWEVPSSKGDRMYEIQRKPDGSFSCNCPGWTFKRKAQDRNCAHIRTIKMLLQSSATVAAGVEAKAASVFEKGAPVRAFKFGNGFGK